MHFPRLALLPLRAEEAIRQYQEALRLKRDDAEAHNNFGLPSSRKAKLTRRSANTGKPPSCNRITLMSRTTSVSLRE